MPLDKPASIILKDCMSLKENESCLIVTDSKLRNIGNIIYKNSLKITKKSRLVLTAIPKAHGAEPPESIAEEMLKHDVILLATTMSLSHTKARKAASENGARIASMPGITIDMMKRALNVDFNKIMKLNKQLISKLKNKNKIRITAKNGTNMGFYTEGRKWIDDNGIYTKKGSFGNLPAGEVFIAPLENETNGTIIVDASIGGTGKVDRNVEIKIKDGFIADVIGGKVSKKFKKSLKNNLYRNVAELGIGTNLKAKITGNVLEDEKVAGTCHIAFGNNMHFGGKIDVPFHVDVVVKKPTIYADSLLLMKDGKFKLRTQSLLY
ncbi:aminopeptidase [Candidatus Woesearchaeota archaeon]|nr:aminopeptidase [Candidatus Woesearchaeota archaeon]